VQSRFGTRGIHDLERNNSPFGGTVPESREEARASIQRMNKGKKGISIQELLSVKTL